MSDLLTTTWEHRSYDVWGNARDGYEVNDSFSHGTVEIKLRREIFNVGTPMQFDGYFPTESQICKALGIGSKVKLDIDGDDIHITVFRARDCYPLGELYCVSHESLSPPRERSV